MQNAYKAIHIGILINDKQIKDVIVNRNMFYCLYLLSLILNILEINWEDTYKIFELLYNETITYINKCERFISTNTNYLYEYNQISMKVLKPSETNVFESVSDFNKNNIGQIDFFLHCINGYSSLLFLASI